MENILQKVKRITANVLALGFIIAVIIFSFTSYQEYETKKADEEDRQELSQIRTRINIACRDFRNLPETQIINDYNFKRLMVDHLDLPDTGNCLYLLGKAYLGGWYRRKDCEIAKEYFGIACVKGDYESCKIHEKLKFTTDLIFDIHLDGTTFTCNKIGH